MVKVNKIMSLIKMATYMYIVYKGKLNILVLNLVVSEDNCKVSQYIHGVCEHGKAVTQYCVLFTVTGLCFFSFNLRKPLL